MPLKARPKKVAAPVVEDAYADEVFEEEVETAAAVYTPAKLHGGWEAARKKSSSGQWSNDLRLEPDQREAIGFLIGEPIDSYDEHWVTRKGRMSFRCTEKADCPLCSVGNVAKPKFVFWVLHLEITDDGDITDTPKLFRTTRKVLDKLFTLNNDPHPRMGGPLEGNWFYILRTGEKEKTEYGFTRVLADDLADDLGVEADDLSAVLLEAQTTAKPVIPAESLEDLKEAASAVRRG